MITKVDVRNLQNALYWYMAGGVFADTACNMASVLLVWLIDWRALVRTKRTGYVCLMCSVFRALIGCVKCVINTILNLWPNNRKYAHWLYWRTVTVCRSQWQRGLRRRSAAARLLGLRVRIPPGAWMSVCCECCVLSGRGLCEGLITRPEEFNRVRCVVVCDLETSITRMPWPTGGWFRHF